MWGYFGYTYRTDFWRATDYWFESNQNSTVLEAETGAQLSEVAELARGVLSILERGCVLQRFELFERVERLEQFWV